MGNDNTITFVNEKNLLDTINAELLCAFELEGVRYVVYSKNEKDYDGNVIVYYGKIIVVDNKQYIRNVDALENDKIKDMLKKMINYSGEEYDV